MYIRYHNILLINCIILFRCFDCNNFLCANCVMAHQFMHCFEGHHVTTLGEITSNPGTRGTHHVQVIIVIMLPH